MLTRPNICRTTTTASLKQSLSGTVQEHIRKNFLSILINMLHRICRVTNKDSAQYTSLNCHLLMIELTDVPSSFVGSRCEDSAPAL
jgi:hypothetical protein